VICAVLLFHPGGALVFGDFGVEFFHALVEFSDEIRVHSCEVVFLAKVGFEIKEHDLGFLFRLVFLLSAFLDEELEVALTESFELPAGGVVDELSAWTFVGSGEKV